MEQESNLSSLPPTDNGDDDIEMGELSEADIKSISMSCNKENDFESVNTYLKEDLKDLKEEPTKKFQVSKHNFVNVNHKSYGKNYNKKPTYKHSFVAYQGESEFQKPMDKCKNPPKIQEAYKKDCLESPLTIQEGQVLLDTWKANQFVDFNSWVQVSKSTLLCDFKENMSIVEESKPSGYSCSLRLNFNQQRHGKLNSFIGNGYGKSKRIAKMMATERLATDLVSTGLIRLGLRDKKFWKKHAKIQQEKKLEKEQILKQGKEEIERNESKMKIAKKHSKNMQKFLFEDKFQDALAELDIIMSLKHIEWKELNFIWCYAVHQQNLLMIKQIIERLSKNRYKRLTQKPEEKEDEQEDKEIHMNSAQYVRKHNAEKVKQKLFSLYGLTRLPNENQYEYNDSYALEINDADIRSQLMQQLPDDEHDKQVVEDPFQKDIKDSLICPPNNEMDFDESPIKKIDQKNLYWPGLTYRDPFQAMQDEKNKGQQIEQEQQDQILKNIQNQLNDPECLRSIQDMENDNLQTKDGDDFVLYRKRQDPKIIHLEKSFIDELYESLYFSGDFSFSLNVSELIYSELSIKEQEFIHPHAADYYLQKKNMQVVEDIEQVYEVFSFNKPRTTQEYLCNLNGNIKKIGSCHSFDSLMMTPTEPQDILETKLLKKCKADVRETAHHIIEDDIVVLTTFFQPSYEKPILKEQTSKLANYINTKAKNSKEQSHFIHSITEFGNTVEFAFIATVRDITTTNQLRIQLLSHQKNDEAFQSVDNNTVWKITKLCSRYQSTKAMEALAQFTSDPKCINSTLFHILLTPPTQSSQMIQKFSQTPDDRLEPMRNKTSLNPAQEKAVQCAASQMLTLIQGPPGSGKTTTCIEIVIEWLRQSGRPILITTENQQSVDILFNELMKANIKAVKIGPGFEEVAENHFKQQRLKTLEKQKQKQDRLDVRDQLRDQIQKSNLELENEDFNEEFAPFSQLNEETQNKEQMEQRKFMQEKTQEENQQKFASPTNQKFMFLKRLLREAPVVVCKVSAVQSDYMKGLHFYRVIIDEAHRCNEILALSALIRDCQKLVMVGDPMSPCVKVNSMFSASKGFYMSLFDKLMMQRVRPIILTHQYRLHSTLIDFPSFYFYNDSIKTQVPDQDIVNLYGYKWPNPSLRNAFVFVKGNEMLVNQGVQNLKEVEVVIEIIMQILKSQYVKTNQIVIFTTTEEQKRRFRTEITYQAKRFSQLFGLTLDEIYRITKHSLLVDVDTLDRSQFYDKDLVIFSPVRSNKHEGLGILKDPRILNSLLFSGRKGLITVGDMETLGADPNWAEYIKWCKRNKLIQYYIK